jgi:hypothetical protein
MEKTSRIEFAGSIDTQEDGFHLIGENANGRFIFIVTRRAAVDGFPISHSSPLNVETHVRRSPDVIYIACRNAFRRAWTGQKEERIIVIPSDFPNHPGDP